MKATLELDANLLRAAKRTAAERGTTLREVVESALRQALAPRRQRPKQLKIVTYPGGIPADLDLSSRQKMWEWFDRCDAEERASKRGPKSNNRT